ncbi:MAG: flagellar biosynthetic protein FliR [Clostridium sp.]|nr:flagellar biosynthetic protein FliR [Clostridium sp.]
MIEYTFSYYDLEYFLLVFVRVSMFVFIAPFFSIQNTPNSVRLGISLCLSILLYFSLTPAVSPTYQTITGYAFIVLKEAVTGALIGYGTVICTTIVSLAGTIADMETGLSMVSLLDPTNNQQSSVTGIIYQYTIILMLLATGMYRYLVGALSDTFLLIPINGAIFHMDSLFASMLQFLRDYILIGFRICLPIFCVGMLLNAILGVLAKIAPQMNMFVVGIQLKVLAGLTALAFTATMLPGAADFIFVQMKKMVVSFVESMMP